MNIRKRRLAGIYITPVNTTGIGLLSPSFEQHPQASWTTQMEKDFASYAKSNLNGFNTSAHLTRTDRLTVLPPVYWAVPNNKKDAKRALEKILTAIQVFVDSHPESDKIGDIALTMVGKEAKTGTLNEVEFNGSPKQLFRIQVRHFWAPVPSIFSGTALLAALIVPLIVACVIVLSFRKDPDLIFDFFAYSLPAMAAIVGGMGLFYPRCQTGYFWASAVFLCAGICCYLASKHIDARLPFAFLLLLASVLIGMLVVDDYRFSWLPKSKFNVYRSFLLSAAIVVVPSAIYLCTQLRRDTPPLQCQLRATAPATINVTTMAPNINNSAIGGSSRDWSLDEGTLITFNPCPK
ncbi:MULTISPECIES: hypothetical protein [unclassified Luteibacter]|uniref:hypothetical protein n=1 Tax=Luteibacter sp. PvP019 TaxID=3156436 RepID=UPI003393860D